MMLLLFDIDGTLLSVDGVGQEAVSRAFSDALGTSVSTDGIAFSGRTDPEILRAVLSHNDLDVSDETVNSVLDAYVRAAQRVIQPADVRILPGVDHLCTSLSKRSGLHLGLVTGNVERVAYHKLQAAGLDHHFPVGAFGSDSRDRSALPPVAIRRASRHAEYAFSPHEVVVIGDTPRDVQCAESAGARSVAVCTGGADRATLAKSNPDVLLDDLRDPAQFTDPTLYE